MFAAFAVVIGTVFLWQLLEGVGLVGWGLFEIIRQMFHETK